MDKRPKPTVPQQNVTHPETKKHVKPGVSDHGSSKAISKSRDGRTGQDKDGNEEHSKLRGDRS